MEKFIPEVDITSEIEPKETKGPIVETVEAIIEQLTFDHKPFDTTGDGGGKAGHFLGKILIPLDPLDPFNRLERHCYFTVVRDCISISLQPQETF